MRVTSSMMVRSTLRDLSMGLSRLQETQAKMSSGKELTRPSVNPGATASAMSMRQDLSRSEQRMRSLDDAKGWLDTADIALTSGLDRLARVKELAVRAANTGALPDQAARDAIAAEVRSVRSELLAIANTQYGGRSIFNGTAAGAAYDALGAYVGNTANVTRDVAANTTMTVNTNGPAAFGTTGGAVGDVFEVLDRLASAISAGDTAAVATEHTNVDGAMSRLGGITVLIGTRAKELEVIRDRAESDKLLVTQQLSEVEDVDIVEALITAKRQESSYQATLAVAAKILPPSLLDYLR
jgi:flagellar hook-associated protein 3 FlgL